MKIKASNKIKATFENLIFAHLIWALLINANNQKSKRWITVRAGLSAHCRSVLPLVANLCLSIFFSTVGHCGERRCDIKLCMTLWFLIVCVYKWYCSHMVENPFVENNCFNFIRRFDFWFFGYRIIYITNNQKSLCWI